MKQKKEFFPFEEKVIVKEYLEVFYALYNYCVNADGLKRMCMTVNFLMWEL